MYMNGLSSAQLHSLRDNSIRCNSEPPGVAFACTRPVLSHSLPPLVLIVRLSVTVAVSELASLTRTVKLLVPVPVGVPEITPVPGARANPAGKVPEMIDQVYGGVPPMTANAEL